MLKQLVAMDKNVLTLNSIISVSTPNMTLDNSRGFLFFRFPYSSMCDYSG